MFVRRGILKGKNQKNVLLICRELLLREITKKLFYGFFKIFEKLQSKLSRQICGTFNEAKPIGLYSSDILGKLYTNVIINLSNISSMMI